METTKLGKYTVTYPNSIEYHTLKREIWGQDCYFFQTEKDNPYIIDIGSHIGISVLYFKSMYPNSTIAAFEPNPYTFEILEENILLNNIENIYCIKKGIDINNGKREIYIDNTDNNWNSNSSFLNGSWNRKENTKPIVIETETLKKYIENIYVDCIKIDTEGYEYEIVKYLRNYFSNINTLLIEYHPIKNKPIKNIINILNPYYNISIFENGKEIKNIPNDKLLIIKAIYKKK